jgi:acetoin utilization deacetylase AcuC-like enzyme
MTIFYDPRCVEYCSPGHPERPERIARTVPLLKERHRDWTWREPHEATDDQLLRAHSRRHIESISRARIDFDADTLSYPSIEMHARRSASAAVEVARCALQGGRAFSLMRPPGHHATRDRAMGFCYFSNAAIAAFDALETNVKRIAIWDFDGHHGNGTEAIVARIEQIRFASIHQFPAYPGTGAKSFENIENDPIAPFTARAEIVEIARRSFNRLVAFEPDLLLVSAGFDAYARDPLLQLTLEHDDFAMFGDWLNQLNIPIAAVLEGGYSDDLPELIDAFLAAWAG